MIPVESKLCAGINGCGELRWIEEFRVLSSGYRAAYCGDCERRFDCWRRNGRHFDFMEVPSGLVPRGCRELFEDDLADRICVRLVVLWAVDEGLLAMSEELASLLAD